MKETLFFGGLDIVEAAGTSHLMIVGSTGSGKTLNLRMTMGSTLPGVLEENADFRGVIFDVKQDMLSILHGILRQSLANGKAWKDLSQDHQRELNQKAAEKIITLNPFDKRCYEWDMAKDVTDPETALQLATILIPEETGSNNRYFSDAARDLLAGVLTFFFENADKSAKRPWGLSDVLYVMRSEERLRRVLEQTDEGKDLIALHMEMERTSKNIVSTGRSFLIPLQVPAALWRHAGEQGRLISLKDFLTKNCLLVLGNNQKALAPIQAINRLVFQRLTELILDQPESDTRRTWIYLDEVRKLGKLDGLSDLMTNGRSKGVCVVLGFQDIDGIRAVYGKEVAGELTSMPATFGILRVSGASTPQWASELFGEQERREITRSVNRAESDQGLTVTKGRNESIREKRVYLSAEFRMIPNPRRGETLNGYFFSPFAEEEDRTPTTWKAEITPAAIQKYLHPKSEAYQDIEHWPLETVKKLPAWEEEDEKRLALPPEGKKTMNEKPKKPRYTKGRGVKDIRSA